MRRKLIQKEKIVFPFIVSIYLNFDTKGMINEITNIDIAMINCVNPLAVGINR